MDERQRVFNKYTRTFGSFPEMPRDQSIDEFVESCKEALRTRQPIKLEQDEEPEE